MVTKTGRTSEHLLTRRCVACGYDGALLRGGFAERCARCGCDLRKRPARSYAEMEGLRCHRAPSIDPSGADVADSRLRRRWLALSIVAMLGLVAILYLASAALAV